MSSTEKYGKWILIIGGLAAVAYLVWRFWAQIVAWLTSIFGSGTIQGLAISASGNVWSITGLTPSGLFQVAENGNAFSDIFQYTASANGTDSRTFNAGSNSSGTLTVTDLTTGKTAQCAFTIS